MDRTERFYKIQGMLAGRRAVPCAQFLRELEISRATFRRDLDYLRDRLGVPIAWDAKAGGYILDQPPGEDARQPLPGLWLNQQEIHALLAGIQLLSSIEPGAILGAHVRPIRERLEKLLEQGQFSAGEVLRRIRLLPLAHRKVPARFFEAVAHALLARKRLFLRYRGRKDDQITEREVSPQRLVYYRDNWYLDAWCHEKAGLRTFAVECICQAEALNKPAKAIADSILDRELASAYGIFSGTPIATAVLCFAPRRARWVADEMWHPQQKSRWLKDGRYELRVPYSNDKELIMDILKFGVDVEVVSPPRLREAVKTQLDAAASQYRHEVVSGSRFEPEA